MDFNLYKKREDIIIFYEKMNINNFSVFRCINRENVNNKNILVMCT